MNLAIVKEIKNELAAANLLMKESLRPWGEEILAYCQGLEEDIHWKMLPVTAALTHRNLGINFRHTVYITAIFRLVYLANYIHALVGDDEEGQQYDRGLQFSILIGDYISGVVLKLLSEIDSHYLIPFFTSMTCQVNEGRVMRKMNGMNGKGGPDLEVMARETASLYRNAFLVAAVTGRLSDSERSLYGEMGHNLGMAIAVETEMYSRSAAYPYLDKAKTLRLVVSRERWIDGGDMVDNLIEELMSGLPGRKMAVV